MEKKTKDRIERLETEIKHLKNELRLTMLEKEKAKEDYFNTITNMDEMVMNRTREVKDLQLVLKNKANELQLMLDAAPSMIFYTDKDHRYIRVNQEFAKVFQMPVREIIGKTFSEIYPEGTDYFAKENSDVMRSGKKIINRPAFVETASDRIEVLVNKIPNKDIDGNVIGIIGFALDVTDLRRAEEEKKELEKRLEQSKKMEAIGRLAGGVAHDLNNVLSALVGYPDLILMNLPDNSPIRKAIQTIQKSGKKASAIVQDLLTLARRGVTINTVINLNDIVEEYFKSLVFQKLKVFYPDVDISYTLDPELKNMNGSAIHLSKMIMNLISNAAEALNKKGEITVTTRNIRLRKTDKRFTDPVPTGEYIRFDVSDNGMGISKEDQEKIFEPFYTKKVMGISGTGLGLAVVWGTVKDHKGYIRIESEKGKGATFSTLFPVSVAKKVEESTMPVQEFLGNKERVLVVDDVEEMREITAMMLKKLNYTFSTFSSGEAAISYLKAHKAEMVLLDMIMDPGMDGLETYQAIKKIVPDQKVIIFSGYSETDRVQKAKKMGVLAYLKKPFTIKKLGEVLQKYLAEPKSD